MSLKKTRRQWIPSRDLKKITGFGVDLLAYDNIVDDARGLLLVSPVRIGGGELAVVLKCVEERSFSLN